MPANAIHTIGMLFSFDLVLLDKNFKVVGLRELVRPFRITMPNPKAESVLELPAHSIFRSRTQVGDQFVIDRYEAKRPSQPEAPVVESPEALPGESDDQTGEPTESPLVPIGPHGTGGANGRRSTAVGSKSR